MNNFDLIERSGNHKEFRYTNKICHYKSGISPGAVHPCSNVKGLIHIRNILICWFYQIQNQDLQQQTHGWESTFSSSGSKSKSSTLRLSPLPGDRKWINLDLNCSCSSARDLSTSSSICKSSGFPLH